MGKELDHIDQAILTHLQEDARITHSDLAQRVKLSPPGLHKRVRKLEQRGIIQGYRARVDREAVGFDMMCFVHVALARHEPASVETFQAAVQGMAEVLACYHMTGDFDYLLQIVVRNRGHLERFLLKSLTPVAGVDRLRTSLVLSEVKSGTALPIGTDGLS